MDGIEKRVQQLERGNRILSVSLLVIGLLLVASFFYSGSGSKTERAVESKTQSKEIVAPRVITRELVIVDHKGNPLGSLMATGEPAFAALELRNGKSKNHCKVSSDQISFINSKSVTRSYMNGGDFGNATVSLRDEAGTTRMILSASRDGEPVLAMGDGDGSSGIEMAVEGKKAIMQYFSPSSDRWEPLIPEKP